MSFGLQYGPRGRGDHLWSSRPLLRAAPATFYTHVGGHGPAQQTQAGSIANIDEPKGTITVLIAPSGTVGANGANSAQELRLQDGLLFDALRYGDQVSFTTAILNSAKTITSLKKE